MSEVLEKTQRSSDAQAELPALTESASEKAPESSLPQSETSGSAQHFGQALAQARQALNLPQTDVAARLRLHLRQVVALEAADFSGLPELAFIRGYVRSYARIVGLDEQPLFDSLNERAQAARHAPEDGVSEERAWMASPHHGGFELLRTWLASRRMLVAVLLGALLIFAVVGVVASRKPSGAGLPGVPDKTSRGADGVAMQDSPANSTVMTATAPAAPSAASDSDALTREAGMGGALPLMGETSIGAGQSAQGPTTLRLVFRERSWAEVAQGDGRVVLSQVIEAGSVRQFSGQPPYRVLIGNANVASVQWRGHDVDLRAHTSYDNVARLTLE